MILKCSEECEESEENPLFSVSVIVSEDRSIAYDIHDKDPRDFECVYCDSVAKEVKGCQGE